jgi:hypothetical protein
MTAGARPPGVGGKPPVVLMILLHCPCTCRKAFLLPDSAAGQTVHCPYSGQPFRLSSQLRPNFGEERWETCDRPTILLSCLHMLRVSLSDRRLRLLAVAVSRRGQPPTRVERWSALLADAERCADGVLPEPERQAAEDEAERLGMQVVYAQGQATWPARLLPHSLRPHGRPGGRPSLLEESAEESGCVREMVGNPFRLRRLLPEWLAWSDRTVPRVAAAIYAERAFDRLPILADALEDAGADADLLNHLRSPGPHALGCWALDLILGKG